MSFNHDHGISSLSFRNDVPIGGGKGAFTSLLAVGDDGGQIILWDLENRRLHTALEDPHNGQVHSLFFLPGQPLLISGGSDNAIKMWLFDSIDGVPRLLKYRSGHKAPPRKIKYYGGVVMATASDGADGTSSQILSAGSDKGK